MDSKKWETMSESDRNAMMDECFAYDDVLLEKGYFGGWGSAPERSERHHPEVEECQSVYHRWPICRDEGAIGRDPRARGQRPESHAIQLMLKHPGVKAGG
jgi:hypothetical protein